MHTSNRLINKKNLPPPPPPPQTLMENHNEVANTKLTMRVLLTRGRVTKNQYLNFFFNYSMKNSSMSLVSKTTSKGVPKSLKSFLFKIHFHVILSTQLNLGCLFMHQKTTLFFHLNSNLEEFVQDAHHIVKVVPNIVVVVSSTY